MKSRIAFLLLLLGLSYVPLLAQTHGSSPAAVQAYKSGDYSTAINLFKKAVKENENDQTSWYMLGSAYLKKGKNKDALKAFERALKIDPKNESGLAGVAIAYMLLRDTRAQSSSVTPPGLSMISLTIGFRFEPAISQ